MEGFSKAFFLLCGGFLDKEKNVKMGEKKRSGGSVAAPSSARPTSRPRRSARPMPSLSLFIHKSHLTQQAQNQTINKQTTVPAARAAHVDRRGADGRAHLPGRQGPSIRPQI